MVVICIVAVLLIGLVLISTEHINHINKAAVAMFMGVSCWMIYIAYGSSFLVSQHQLDFLSYLGTMPAHAASVKEYIADHIFLHYSLRAASVVLYLLSVMSIVEVLNNNGCFDFIQEWLRTRNSRRFLWVLALMTFFLSAHLDNLITTCLMLSIMHTMISGEKQRMILGSMIVIAANCGGAFTVIGDASSLTLWEAGLVTPTTYTFLLAPACLVAFLTILLLVQRTLPDRLTLVQVNPPYRGDDTVLTRGQRLLMLLVGIGGLWFVPTFHRITLMPSFVGALCVLALLWIVNELCNRSLLTSDQMVRKRAPMALQYANIQNMLYYIGLTLTFGAVTEIGVLQQFFVWLTGYLKADIYAVSAGSGLLSAVMGNVATILSNVAVFTQDIVQQHPDFELLFAKNGAFWPLISYTTSLGGSLFCIGTFAGFALMRMEGVSLRWYIRHISGKVLAGWLVGLLVFYAVHVWL